MKRCVISSVCELNTQRVNKMFMLTPCSMRCDAVGTLTDDIGIITAKVFRD